MNPDPDYSAAYVVLRTDAEDGLEGHGFAFTIGRGNDIQVAAIAALRPYLVGRDADMEVCGPDFRIAVDANQRWDVPDAIDWINALAPYEPWWIEEPTSPDDVVGHAAIARAVAPIKVATGEHVQNRIVFKQLLQLKALSYLQIDAARVAGVNENIAILLLAAKFGVPVCPHAGGVGLCELVQHLSMFDFVAVSGSLHDRAIEYVDHLHEHFVDPIRLRRGSYLAPLAPGFSATIHPDVIETYAFPDGPIWKEEN